MLHNRFLYRGFDVSRNKVVADADTQKSMALLAKERLSNVLDVQNDQGIRDADCIQFIGFKACPEEAFKVIKKLKNTQYLHLPTWLLEGLSDVKLPRLETLLVDGTDKTILPASFNNKNMIRLASPNSVCLFSKDQLPNLTDFNMQFDSQGKVMKEIMRYVNIEVLTLSKIKAIPAWPVPDSIKFLRIRGCNLLPSLAKVGQFHNITDLLISDIRQLVDIITLDELQKLEELTIAYCPNLRDVSPLKALRLKKLCVYGCRMLNRSDVEKYLHSDTLLQM